MAPANQSDRFPSQQDFLNDGRCGKKGHVFASPYPNIINRKTACWTSSWCWPCIIRHGLCLFPHGLCSLDPRDGRWLCLLKWNIFRKVLQKRSLFPSQLAFIENGNIFTLFTILIAPIVWNGPRARTIQVPLGSAKVEVKRNRKRRQTFMGAQIILGTPLFSADVFQWARFRNGVPLFKFSLKWREAKMCLVKKYKKQDRGYS